MTLDTTLRSELDTLVKSNQVVLFMKGDRRQPRCGFSARVVTNLDLLLDDYVAVDVLAREDVREAVKAYSDWPTLPQLYVGGEFVGGCDIVDEMTASGELARLLGLPDQPPPLPEITVSAAAAAELRAALPVAGSAVRLTVTTDYRSDLTAGQARATDLRVETGGVTILVDPFSARRADGLEVDFVRDGIHSGFTITNRKAPAVANLPVAELARWQTEGRDFELLDQRSPSEWESGMIPGARAWDGGFATLGHDLPRHRPIVVYCHSGGRSTAAAARLCAAGFTAVYNLTGGIQAWAAAGAPGRRPS